MQKACNMSHLIIITCVLSLPLSLFSTDQYTVHQKMWLLNWWMWKIVWEGISLNEPNSTQSEIKGFPGSNCLITSTLMTVSGVGQLHWMRELSKSHYSRRICPPQCVRVIQTRKVRTGQNTSIYHRMNGINGYEFELLFKWVSKLNLWEPRVLPDRIYQRETKTQSFEGNLEKVNYSNRSQHSLYPGVG